MRFGAVELENHSIGKILIGFNFITAKLLGNRLCDKLGVFPVVASGNDCYK